MEWAPEHDSIVAMAEAVLALGAADVRAGGTFHGRPRRIPGPIVSRRNE